jgi:hypothetical protein
MKISYKSFITVLALMLGMGVTAAHAKGPVHDAVDKIADFAYKVYEKDGKWVEKKAGKVAEYAVKGEEAVAKWCGDHKETCAREIKNMAEDIGEIAEEVGEELVEEAPEILEAIVIVLGSLADEKK